jgi:hypothetical protein
MILVSYFGLNQPYVINTIIFFGTFVVLILWMHIYLHASVMNTIGATCNDPIAKFFNKRLAERCYVDSLNRGSTWVETNLDKIIETIEKRQTETNSRILGLYKLYDDRNKQKAMANVKFIEDKQKALNDLQTVVTDLKTGFSENEENIGNFLSDYRQLIMENVGKLQNLAIEIKNKLQRNIYTKKWEKDRKKYVTSYGKIQSYIKKLNRDKFMDAEIPEIMDLESYEKTGKR